MNGSGVSKPGFFYGYVVVGCSFLILMVMWGAQYCFGVFFKPMLKEMGLSRAMLSGAYSMNMILQAVACIFIGKLSDKYGPRLVVSICGASLGISYLLMSQVQMVWQIYVIFGILASISVAGSWVPTMSTIARWFVARRGVMCGLAAAGVGLGVMILPPLAGYLIASFGWAHRLHDHRPGGPGRGDDQRAAAEARPRADGVSGAWRGRRGERRSVRLYLQRGAAHAPVLGCSAPCFWFWAYVCRPCLSTLCLMRRMWALRK